MKFRLLVILGFLANTLFSQTINIVDADYIPLNCANFNDGSAINFFDDGNGANYGANRRDTIVVCPNLPNGGPKVFLSFGINAGYSFDVHASDTIYVFDGPSVNAPLLGTLNSSINANGQSYNSSFENNPSGCLTVVFHSDASNEGTGWGANITCGNPAQPFYPHIEAYINGTGSNALNPLDTGYVDICLGDSIMLVAKPDFPYSDEVNGYGYSQNVDIVDYEWELSNGWAGPNNDTIWYKPATRSGFYVSLRITDNFPLLEQTFCKIRVSQLPLFTETGPVEDPICVFESGLILGGATPQDTVGVEFPPGSFEIGGTVAGLTYLPDGSGQEYSTTISMAGFPVGATFASASDLQSVCLNMEHSFLGDLEVWLTCPNGTEVSLINSYSPGHIAGGFGGGSTYLGHADDNGNGNPGIGLEYCFSTVNSTWGTMETEYGANNTITSTIAPTGPTMNPDGVYQPDVSFANFIGCPLNGDWTITVRDNQSIDDGYIFEWGLYFDASLFPNLETYNNYLVEDHWVNDPTIISSQNDTSIVVRPGGPGPHSYTFVVTDDFGCVYDTTVTITVKDPIVLDMIPETCAQSLTTTLNTGTNDGVWSFFGSAGTPTFTVNDVNTTINFPTYGVYNLVYSDTSCTNKDTAQVKILSSPTVTVDDQIICSGDPGTLVAVSSDQNVNYDWNTGSTEQSISVLNEGYYTVSASNLCGSDEDSAYVTVELCVIQFPNVFTPTLDGTNETFKLLNFASGFEIFEVKIFNRWGNKMFEFDSPLEYWDGKNDSGNLASPGVYYYEFYGKTITGKEITQDGFFHLIAP